MLQGKGINPYLGSGTHISRPLRILVGYVNVCLPFAIYHSMTAYTPALVFRVNWLRAKSRRDRWAEEVELLFSEMEWVKRYHDHQRGIWSNRASQAESAKDDIFYYALRQEKTWELLGSQAENALRLMTKAKERQ